MCIFGWKQGISAIGKKNNGLKNGKIRAFVIITFIDAY